MSVYIEWKGRDILVGNNSTMEIIRLQIEDIIRENKIILNKDLSEIMSALDQAGNGFGFDVANYLHTKKDILTFTDLVRKGIDRYNQEEDFWENTGLIERFYQELETISESFPGNGVLKCQKTIIEIYRLGIVYLKRDNKITLNENVTKIMENLNQASSPHGLPLTEYLHTKEDLRAFIDLMKSAIDKYIQICKNAQQITSDRLEGFYQELIKIGESFPG